MSHTCLGRILNEKHGNIKKILLLHHLPHSPPLFVMITALLQITSSSASTLFPPLLSLPPWKVQSAAGKAGMQETRLMAMAEDLGNRPRNGGSSTLIVASGRTKDRLVQTTMKRKAPSRPIFKYCHLFLRRACRSDKPSSGGGRFLKSASP